jgi:hypothetical protein
MCIQCLGHFSPMLPPPPLPPTLPHPSIPHPLRTLHIIPWSGHTPHIEPLLHYTRRLTRTHLFTAEILLFMSSAHRVVVTVSSTFLFWAWSELAWLSMIQPLGAQVHLLWTLNRSCWILHIALSSASYLGHLSLPIAV